MSDSFLRTLRCKRCKEPLQVFVYPGTDNIFIGCRYRTCPIRIVSVNGESGVVPDAIRELALGEQEVQP